MPATLATIFKVIGVIVSVTCGMTMGDFLAFLVYFHIKERRLLTEAEWYEEARRILSVSMRYAMAATMAIILYLTKS